MNGNDEAFIERLNTFIRKGDDYGYYQTLGLKLVRKDLFEHNYALGLKDLNVWHTI